MCQKHGNPVIIKIGIIYTREVYITPLSARWQHVAPPGVVSGNIWHQHKFPEDYVRGSGSVFGRRSLLVVLAPPSEPALPSRAQTNSKYRHPPSPTHYITEHITQS